MPSLTKISSNRTSKLTEPSPAHTLDKVRAGQSVKVVETAAGQAATLQLAQLGIRAGATLVVRRSAPLGGPILVESSGSTVAIGRGMARKVLVQSLE
ncbi:MAG TPA: FeoA family protein [Terriglobia bacterium]|nr:FeoA family protein [Terriglobia bacterium]